MNIYKIYSVFLEFKILSEPMKHRPTWKYGAAHWLVIAHKKLFSVGSAQFYQEIDLQFEFR